MGCDIHLFCEGYLKGRFDKEKKWINIDHWYRQDGWPEYVITEYQGFNYTNLIDGRRDYGLFYLLAGVRGTDEERSYPPIAQAKGLPEQMDSLIKKYYEDFYGYHMDTIPKTEKENIDVHHASYLTLRELKDSGYGKIMPLKGWVHKDKLDEALTAIQNGRKYQTNFIDTKCQNPAFRKGMILREWDGYINLNLTDMIGKMERLKEERNIEYDDEIRIVFWFDN